MSATYHIFYNSDKEIMWSATAGVDSTIITGQKSNNNYDYVSLTLSETPIGEKYYINADATGVVENSTFTPTFSTTAPALDAVVNVTGVPAGTEVFLDGTSVGTMSDTTLTLTAQEAGTFTVLFKKHYYYNYTQSITVKRYGE